MIAIYYLLTMFLIYFDFCRRQLKLNFLKRCLVLLHYIETFLSSFYIKQQLVQVPLTSLIYVGDNVQSVGHHCKINPDRVIICDND